MCKHRTFRLLNVTLWLLLVGILPFFIYSCSSREEQAESRAKSLAKRLIGHWVSLDGKEHLYFSEDSRILLISDGKTYWNSPYSYSFFVPTEKTDSESIGKFRNILFIDFESISAPYSSSTRQVVKLSKDGREICIMSPSNYTLDPLVVGSPGNYRYTDSSQHP